MPSTLRILVTQTRSIACRSVVPARRTLTLHSPFGVLHAQDELPETPAWAQTNAGQAELPSDVSGPLFNRQTYVLSQPDASGDKVHLGAYPAAIPYTEEPDVDSDDNSLPSSRIRIMEK